MNEDYKSKLRVAAIERTVCVLHMAEQLLWARLTRVINEIINQKLLHFQPIKSDYKTIARRKKTWDSQL